MTDFYLNERMMQLSVEEEHHQAAPPPAKGDWRGPHKLAGAAAKPGTELVGCCLVSSGQRLLQSVSPPPPSAEGRSKSRDLRGSCRHQRI